MSEEISTTLLMPFTAKELVEFVVLPFCRVTARCGGVSVHGFLGNTSMTSSAALCSLPGHHPCPAPERGVPSASVPGQLIFYSFYEV